MSIGIGMRVVIEIQAKDIMKKMMDSVSDQVSYNYYQGRLDSLSWILKQFPND